MNYQTYQPHSDLNALVKFYWTLEVPFDPRNKKQKLIPDGCIEMTFNFRDPIKKYISETEYVIHPNCMVMGQRTNSFYIEPTGEVESFAVCFYPFGFASFVREPLENLVDKEVTLESLFGTAQAEKLEQNIFDAKSSEERIRIIEDFLFERLNETVIVDDLIAQTVSTLIKTNGSDSIRSIIQNDTAQRRKLERKFKKHIGISPKQLGRIIRLQTALRLILSQNQNLTSIAYESDYFDQSHFIKDFKEFIGSTPKQMLSQKENMRLSTLFYQET